MKLTSQLVLSSTLGLLFTSCNVSNQASGRAADKETTKFGEGVDSIKVEVSTKVGGTRSIILQKKAYPMKCLQNVKGSV